jgi:hypothetical protein
VGDKIVIVILKKIGGYWLQFNSRGVILDSNLLNNKLNFRHFRYIFFNMDGMDIIILQRWMAKIECSLLVNFSKIK